MMAYNTMIVIAGASLLGAAAGIIGSFAVLRRRALAGDALAHAALPGLALAFVITGERSLGVLLTGAFASGIVGVLVIAGLTRWTRIKEDAAIGIVLGVFFGVGIALTTYILQHSTAGGRAGLNAFILGKTAGMLMQDVILIGILAAGALLVVLLLYKEFKLTIFDPAFARSLGWPVMLLDLGLMTLIAVAVVIGLPAVGVVMIAALLIIPGATARFWTERLGVMLVLSAVFGVAIAVSGSLASATFDLLPAGPVIVLAGTTLFVFSMFFAPRRGIFSRLISFRSFQRQIGRRNLLRVMFDLSEPELPKRPAFSLEQLSHQRSWPARQLRRLLRSATSDRLVERLANGDYCLTHDGVTRGAKVALGYRLWQVFLLEYPETATGAADLSVESVESILPAEVVARLMERLRGDGDLPGDTGAWQGVPA